MWQTIEELDPATLDTHLFALKNWKILKLLDEPSCALIHFALKSRRTFFAFVFHWQMCVFLFGIGKE